MARSATSAIAAKLYVLHDLIVASEQYMTFDSFDLTAFAEMFEHIISRKIMTTSLSFYTFPFGVEI